MRIFALLLTSVVLHASWAWAGEDAELALTADIPNAEVDERIETSAGGGVVLDGRYLAPPYNLVAVAEGLELNGHFVPEAGFNERSRRRQDDARHVPFATRIRSRLDDGGWLLGWEEGEYGMLSESRISDVIYALSSDSSANKKIDELEATGVAWIERAEWRLLVERCKLPESVLRQHGAIYDTTTPVDPALVASVEAPMRNFQTSLYLVTVFGMGATVFALGTLLSYRPVEKMSWSQVNLSKEASQLVLRSIILLIGLAVLDLVCTTISARTAGFWEMNPLGAVALYSPLVLGAFKIGVTLFSGGILFSLRRYHGAQVASWWMALFCTVLAIRWVTYNSMFMV